MSSGNIKSVDVFSVDCENNMKFSWGQNYLRLQNWKQKVKLSVLQIPFLTAVPLGFVLLCCCIEIKVLKNIPVQGVQAGNLKTTCRNFSCLHLHVCITKEFRYFIMRYCALILQLPTPYFLSIVVLSVVSWMFCLMAGIYVLSGGSKEMVATWHSLAWTIRRRVLLCAVCPSTMTNTGSDADGFVTQKNVQTIP